MAHIMVVGAGIGGVPCAFELRKKLDKTHRVTLVGSSPYFEFTPSNPWIAVGWRRREKTRVELHKPLEAIGIEWHEEPVDAIDAANNSVCLRGGINLQYGHMGLGGVGDSKSLMESELRQRHIKWIVNAKSDAVTHGSMLVSEHDDEGKPRKQQELPFKYAMVILAFKVVDPVATVPGLLGIAPLKARRS